jgi:hypothetical protein
MENDIVKVHTTIEHDIAMVYKGINTNLQNKANA